jgi:Metallo-peptidase family M12
VDISLRIAKSSSRKDHCSIATLALIFFCLVLSKAAMPGEYVPLINAESLDWKPSLAKRYPEVVREVRVEIPPKSINALMDRDNESFYLGMPKGTPRLVMTKTTYKVRRNGTVIRNGLTNGSRYDRATFTVKNGVLFGSVLLPNGRAYRIRQERGDHYVIEEIDRSKFPPEACLEEKDRTSQLLSLGRMHRVGTETTDHICTPEESVDNIDVLVVHTKAAKDEAEGTVNLGLAVEVAIEETNTSYTNSGISQQISLLDPIVELEGYTEESSVYNILNRLRNPSDSVFSKVHERRESIGADIVVLVTKKIGPCGRAKTMSTVSHDAAKEAFAVVSFHCLAGSFALAHELGHIMGARHDLHQDATRNAPFAFNHGHVQLSPSNPDVSPWLTVMGTQKKCQDHNENHPEDEKKCVRIAYWSNPDEGFDFYGDQLGVVGDSDNRQTLNKTATTVANFRCSE